MTKMFKVIMSASMLLAFAFACYLSRVQYRESREAAAILQAPYTVVIDAGHGGEDGGATSVSGVNESQINLEIAQKMDDFLALIGFSTAMVRKSDVAIYDAGLTGISEKKVSDLKNRVKFVNQTVNPLLLSIHQNKFAEEKYSGAQVFYADTDGSRTWAELTQQALIHTVDPSNHRMIKPADTVYLMKNIQCSGILVECGFLSNTKEDLKLQDTAYQKKLTIAIASALAKWVSEESEQSEI